MKFFAYHAGTFFIYREKNTKNYKYHDVQISRMLDLCDLGLTYFIKNTEK